MINRRLKLLLFILIHFALLLLSCQWNPSQMSYNDDGKNWMSKLSDTRRLTTLSIPGTHDTCALYDYLIGGASANQDVSLYEQLNQGVRFLDIRVTKRDGVLGIYHGIKYMYIDLEDVILITERFLKENPTEFVLMMIKEEVFRSSGSGENITDDIFTLTNSDRYKYLFASWKDTETSPTVGDLRGKILIIKNFIDSNLGVIPSLNIWKSNIHWVREGDSAYVPQGDIQSVEDKWNQVRNYIIKRSNLSDDGRLYMHSVASYYEEILGLPNIDRVAKYVNPRLLNYLISNKTSLKNKPLGILMCDKIYPSLSEAIYSLNFD